MRQIFWLGTTLVFFTATLGLTAWPDLKDLAHQREWRVARVSTAEGELAGIRVEVRDARAAVVESKPDRALLLVRLDLQGPPEAAASWVDCRISLRGADGAVWLPLHSHSTRGAAKILAPDGKDNGTCNTRSVSGDAPATFDQLYRLPSSALDDLTLHVSGYGTRPSALAFDIKPTVRTFK
ncbi:hypothetical protein [Ancylobacter oerskovii]|uniref:Uncharacterized protein n=1 Tax=Ancylobacter oerskovii TaxID=459519 RepID=A0ABW4YZG8_9HYPH|nr:hypothetical protein [Ancylobacter oerskovii]MBS7544000.1 hypothetical protein [Ancylobacter oerskovii]